MTLTRLLEIDRSLLPADSYRAVDLAEHVWRAKGSPTDKRGLCQVLEAILQECSSSGVLYPPVFLKRKKQLERGDWLPAAVKAPENATDNAQPGLCTMCRGSGQVWDETGRVYKFCPCGVWRHVLMGQGEAK